MLPVVRLHRLGFRATLLASNRLDLLHTLFPSSSSTLISSAASLDRQHQEQIVLIKNIEKLESSFKEDEKRYGPTRNLTEVFERLALLKKRSDPSAAPLATADPALSQASDHVVVAENEDQQLHLQEALFLASFTSSLILQLYNLGVQDRTLWLQLKTLALRVNAYSSSLAIVNSLECLARRSVCGPLECKAFQLQLGSDIGALPPIDILRFIASCQLCGAPLQENVKAVITAQGMSWIENAHVNCCMWWVLADVVDQLPATTRQSLVYHLVLALEKIRASSSFAGDRLHHHHHHHRHLYQHDDKSHEHSKLKQLWPQHEKDTTFILWRLRTNSNLSLTSTISSSNSSSSSSSVNSTHRKPNLNRSHNVNNNNYSDVPKEFNPSYSDALLSSICVERLPNARSALFLLRALCLGVEDLSDAAKNVADEVCRLIHSNVLDSRIQSHFVLRTIVHSVASEQMRTRVPSAALLGVEASLQYLRHHSHYITNETTCCILKILLSLKEQSAVPSQLVVEQVAAKLQQSMRRLMLISPSSAELHDLLSLAHQAEILDYDVAAFALLLMEAQNAPSHELRKCSLILESLGLKASNKDKHSSNNNNNNKNSEPREHQTEEDRLKVESSNKEKVQRTSFPSLVTNWSEIRALSAPKIAFFAVSAAKQIFAPSSSSSSSIIANATVVAPNSNIVSSISSGSSSTTSSSSSLSSSSSSSQQQPQHNNNNNTNSSTLHTADGGLFSLCSAESEIATHHKGLRSLSASDCATLIGATTVLPSEAKSMVLRMDTSSSLKSSSSSSASQISTSKSQNRGDDDDFNTSNNHCTINHHPLFLELQSTVKFLEAQCCINTSLELNSGSDSAIFTSAQRRLARLFQFAHPPPMEFSENPLWVEWSGRLVAAAALHRLSTLRLPLWLMNVFCFKYCSSSLTAFRALRALYACCYFGIDNKEAVENGLMKKFLSSSSSSSMSPSPSVGGVADNNEHELSPSAMLQLLRSLPHIAANDTIVAFGEKIAKPSVEKWLDECTAKLNEAKEQRDAKKSFCARASAHEAAPKASTAATPDESNKFKAVSPFQNAVLFKGGFGSSSSTSSAAASPSSSQSYFTTFKKRRMFDVLCCAAQLDLPPVQFKHLIEHLHPFDTSLYPLANAMFFFGHAAQKKRLSGFSLRVWRSLTMQLDKVSLNPLTSGVSSETLSSSSSASLGSASRANLDSAFSAVAALAQHHHHHHHHGASSSGTSCGLPLVQTSMMVPPTLLSLAYYISHGGGSSSLDSLLDKLQRYGPFEPLVLAKVVRIALAPSGIKTRPSLSQLVCRSFDSTAAQGFASNDLVLVMEVFHRNQAQRVSVGIIQADATVTLAWEALYPRLDSVSDDLFMRAAAIPCSASLHSGFVTKILKRLIRIASSSSSSSASMSICSVKNEVQPSILNSNIVVRDRHIWTPIVFQHVVSHVANVRNFHSRGCSSSSSSSSAYDYDSDRLESSSESDGDISFVKSQQPPSTSKNERDENFISSIMNDNELDEDAAEFWEEIKKHLLEPLQSHLRGADKEAVDELLAM